MLDIPGQLFECKCKLIYFTWRTIFSTPFFIRQSEKTVLRQDQYDHLRSNYDGQVDKNNSSTLFPNYQGVNIEHPDVHYETIDAEPNERDVDNRNELIMPFDFDGTYGKWDQRIASRYSV
jgi:hypothetical protein